MRRFWTEPYGCQMSVAESNAIEAMLLGLGWEKAASPQEAQAVVLNTCSVRQTAENRVWGRLGYYAHLKRTRPLVLALVGCMAQRIPSELERRAPHLDIIAGTNDKFAVVQALDRMVAEDGRVEAGKRAVMLEAPSYSFAPIHWKEGDLRASVPIMNGCDNFCAYCIVPYVRGREVSRAPEEVLSEIDALEAKGVREIELLGQNVNSYSCGGLDFAALLEKVHPRLDSCRWLRFDSPHPKDFSDRLVEALAALPRVARHYHIPLQSGSDRILRLMNRGHSVERYLSIIEKIRRAVPEATFSTDVMVGFPSETEAEAMETVSLMEEVGFTEAFMYYWNPREGTRADRMPGRIPEEERVARLQTLIARQLESAARLKSREIGKTRPVMVLGPSRDDPSMLLGRGEHNEMAVFDAPSRGAAVGDIVSVRFVSLEGNTFKGVCDDGRN